MRHAKPIAVAAGALLFSGLFNQSAFAQENLTGTAKLASSGGASDISVAYTVTGTANPNSPTGYTYEYTYNATDSTTGVLESLELGFTVTQGTIASGANVITLPTTTVSGGSSTSLLPGGLEWFAITMAGKSTGTLEFESDYSSVMANANAAGSNPGPWASSNTGGQQLPVPNTAVPEPAVASLLTAVGISLLPLRKNILKRFGS